MSASTKRSSSHVQRAAEQEARLLLSRELGITLEEKDVGLPGGSVVRVDAVAPDESVFVEIFARQGKLKTGQRHKIATDALKLATIAKARPGARVIVAMCDEAALAGISGWLSEALDAWGIERRLINLPPELRGEISEAQRQQTMVNPALDELAGDVDEIGGDA